jgi:hypothetical protein
VHDKSPFGFYLFESARAHEVRGLSIHGGSSSKLSAATPFSKGTPLFVNPASDVALRLISREARHGLPITHQQQLNADLLAFIKS